MAEGNQNGKGSTAADLAKSAWTAAVPLVVSAVVSIGFVAFAGKAILWARFEAIQVPGEQVVKAVPQSEAVATGASLLLIFGVLGLLAVLAVYMIDASGRATANMSRGVLAVVAAEALVATWLTEGKSLPDKALVGEVVLLALGAILWATYVAKLARGKEFKGLREGEFEQRPNGAFYRAGAHREEGRCCDEPTSGFTGKDLRRVLALALVVAIVGFTVACLVHSLRDWRWVAAVGFFGCVLVAVVALFAYRFRKREEAAQTKAATEAAKKKAEAEAGTPPQQDEDPAVEPPDEHAGDGGGGADDETAKQTGVDLTGWGALFVLACAGLLVVVPWRVLNEWWLGVSLIVAVLLGAGLWRIAGMSRKRFAWFGLAVFISVPLCGTVMMMTRNLDEPKVQPLALIRTTDGPDEAIEGLYVTETPDRVYFANVATEGCSDEVTPHSGRLLWVPSKEVVSTEIGPLQNVGDAGRSALEMSHELTPGIETAGATFDLAPATAAQAGTGAAKSKAAKGAEPRLQNLGPAVRPNFGTGLRVEPETVSPGKEATLRLSEENKNVNGFGASRFGRNLWLGGRRLDISKEPAGEAAGAEYIELENGRLVKLERRAVYYEHDKRFVSKREADEEGFDETEPFVRIDDPAVLKPTGAGRNVRVDEIKGGAIVDGAEERTVELAAGRFEGQTWESTEMQKLQRRPLVRQAWHTDHIRFHVPKDARSGVVSVGCDQLSGAPLLQVRHKPDARIAVRVPPNRSVLTFSGRPSITGPPAHALPKADDGRPAPNLIRSWRVDGVRQGHGAVVHLRLTPRWTPYTVQLKVTDREGNSDTAKLRILRLPAPDLARLRQTWKKPRDPALLRARRQILTIVDSDKPAAVELDGYTNGGGGVDHDVKASLRFDDLVRQYFLHDRHPGRGERGATASETAAAERRRPIPVEEMGHGETCPLRRHPASARAHVDLFLLDQGVVVKPVAHCHALGRRQVLWRPPTAAERTRERGERNEAREANEQKGSKKKAQVLP
jgi:hypothetical protein